MSMVGRKLLLLLALVVSADAQFRWHTRKQSIRYMHGKTDPYEGHKQRPNEPYPGHNQHTKHPYMMPVHRNHELLTAAMSGDVAWVAQLLRSERVPVDFQHHDGSGTALQFAAMNHTMSTPARDGGEVNATRVLAMLLEHGADPEHGADRDGRTPLMTACRWKHAPAVQMLVEAGAHPDRTIKHGSSRGESAVSICTKHCPECMPHLRHSSVAGALDRRRAYVEKMLRDAMRTYTSRTWGVLMRLLGYPFAGDECWLHRALDFAREAPTVDPQLVERARGLRGAMSEELMDLLEVRHVCEEVVYELYRFEKYTLNDLVELSIEMIDHITSLGLFESHMLYMAAQKAIKRHGINKRQQAEAERKDEVRRMQERMGAEPCGDGAWPRGAA